MPGLPYRLCVILQTIFHHSHIFRHRQRLACTPTPPTPTINEHVTQFINKHFPEVTEETPVYAIQHLHAALIQVNEEYIAREQAEINNLHHIIHEAQDILEIKAGEINEDSTMAFETVEGTPHADSPVSNAPT